MPGFQFQHPFFANFSTSNAKNGTNSNAAPTLAEKKKVTDMLIKVKQLLDAGQPDTELADRFLRKCVEDHPNDHRGLDAYGEFLCQFGAEDPDAARELFCRSIQLHPGYGDNLSAKKYLYLAQMSDGHDALRLYEEALKVVGYVNVEEDAGGQHLAGGIFGNASAANRASSRSSSCKKKQSSCKKSGKTNMRSSSRKNDFHGATANNNAATSNNTSATEGTSNTTTTGRSTTGSDHPYPAGRDKELDELENVLHAEEKPVSAGTILVAMSEIYMTDLCDEPEAEEQCKFFLEKAYEYDETHPEVQVALACFHKTVQNIEKAIEYATTAYETVLKINEKACQLFDVEGGDEEDRENEKMEDVAADVDHAKNKICSSQNNNKRNSSRASSRKNSKTLLASAAITDTINITSSSSCSSTTTSLVNGNKTLSTTTSSTSTTVMIGHQATGAGAVAVAAAEQASGCYVAQESSTTSGSCTSNAGVDNMDVDMVDTTFAESSPAGSPASLLEGEMGNTNTTAITDAEQKMLMETEFDSDMENLDSDEEEDSADDNDLDDAPPELQIKLVTTMIDLRMFTEAEGLLSHLIQLNEEDVQCWYLLATLHCTNGDLATAEECYERATEILQKMPDCLEDWRENFTSLQRRIAKLQQEQHPVGTNTTAGAGGSSSIGAATTSARHRSTSRGSTGSSGSRGSNRGGRR